MAMTETNPRGMAKRGEAGGIKAAAAKALDEYRRSQSRQKEVEHREQLRDAAGHLSTNRARVAELLSEMLGRRVEVSDDSTPEDMAMGEDHHSLHSAEGLSFSFSPAYRNWSGSEPEELRLLVGDRRSEPLKSLAQLGEALQGSEDGTWYGWEVFESIREEGFRGPRGAVPV